MKKANKVEDAKVTVLATQQVVNIEISKLYVDATERKMSLKEKTVEFLTTSITSIGLLNPIIVSVYEETIHQMQEKPQEYTHKLVAGLHRLEACKRLKMTTIPAIVYGSKDIEPSKLIEVEISENIARNNERSMPERCSILFELNKQLEEAGLKAGAGKPGKDSKMYTMKQIGAQIGVKEEACKEYIATWKKLSVEARVNALNHDIKNVKHLDAIGALEPSEQCKAILDYKAWVKKNIQKPGSAGNASGSGNSDTKEVDKIRKLLEKEQDKNTALATENKKLTEQVEALVNDHNTKVEQMKQLTEECGKQVGLKMKAESDLNKLKKAVAATPKELPEPVLKDIYWLAQTVGMFAGETATDIMIRVDEIEKNYYGSVELLKKAQPAK